MPVPKIETNKRVGQHNNLTQLPKDIDIDASTRFSLDYQVAILYQKLATNYTYYEILIKVEERLASMNIELRIRMVEQIYIPCKERSSELQEVLEWDH